MDDKVSNKQKLTSVMTAIFGNYDFTYVTSMEAFYYKSNDERLYVPLSRRQLENIIRDTYLPQFGDYSAAEMDNTRKVILSRVVSERDDLDRSIVMVSDYTYWDAEGGTLTHDANRPCFFKLFNTKVPTKHTPLISPFTKSQDKHMWEKYKETIAVLEAEQPLPIEYEFIKVWANGQEDVYYDMLNSFAACFLKKKPLGSYILVGETRNGKSTFVGLLHTIFGLSNTSQVQLTQLGDAHHTHTLLTTLMNAPDEEKDKAIDDQAFFKVMSDHGQLKLPVMRSNVPITLSCDFMSFFPMNHIPEWTGTGAQACIKRSLVLPFYADLSEYDNASDSFAEETYTADMLCDFLGTVFGLAHYYSSHPFTFGETMHAEQEVLINETDSCVSYRKQWEKIYDGFETDRLLFDDYAAWCKVNDVPIKTMKELKFVFRQYKSNRSSIRVNGVRHSIYRIPKPNHRQFIAEQYLSELGRTIESIVNSDLSTVQCLLDYYDAKGWDKL